jgi:hypothetical protein
LSNKYERIEAAASCVLHEEEDTKLLFSMEICSCAALNAHASLEALKYGMHANPPLCASSAHVYLMHPFVASVLHAGEQIGTSLLSMKKALGSFIKKFKIIPHVLKQTAEKMKTNRGFIFFDDNFKCTHNLLTSRTASLIQCLVFNFFGERRVFF